MLLEQWAWGKASSPFVQQVAAAAKADGLEHAEIAALAKLGGSGKYPGNCHRDLVRLVNPTQITESISNHQVVLLSAKKNAVEVETSLVLPHELFAALWTDHKEKFAEVLNPDKCLQFWEAMEGCPAYTSRPWIAEHKAHTIPLGIFGDAVAYVRVKASGSRSMEGLAWHSLLSKEVTKSSMFLIGALPKHVVKRDGFAASWTRLWRILAWSLTALLEGNWPAVDYRGHEFEPSSLPHARAGKELAGGWRAAVWAIQGDLEWFQQQYGLNNPNSNAPCCLCRADRGQDSKDATK